MSKNTILWMVIGVLVVVAIIFALTRKSGSEGEPVSQTQTTQDSSSTAPAAADSKVADSKNLNNCTRNYDANKFANMKVEYQNKVATITVRGFGDIKVALNDAAAPKTVENFVKLSESGFYDCLTFHRISNLTGSATAPGRIIQGGDPSGNGTGGPGYTIPAEIKLLHTKGAIAMARTGDEVNPKRDSSGSQFYIAVDPLPFLDNAYTVFGQIIEGWDVADKISKVAIIGTSDGPPKEPIIIEKITITNK